MKKKSRKSTSKTTIKKWVIKTVAYGILGIISFTLLLTLLVYIGAFGSLPRPAELKQVKHYQASEIITADDKLLGRYYIQNRTDVSLEEIPQHFIDALVATEDARFYKHNGVDFRSTMRVLIKSVLLFDKSAGGGSTLSQQLAKNLYPRKSYWIFTMPVAKIKEIMIARRLEKVYPKEDILELYLNTVSFGENTYGIETASLIYFRKQPKNLKIEEAALLAGMLKANSNYNPRYNYDAALRRRNTVFNQMIKYRYLTPEEGDSLKALEIKLNYQKLNHVEGPAPYFREYLRHEAEAIVSQIYKEDGTPYNIYTDGLRINTTLNSRFQHYAELAVQEHMKRLQANFDAHWKGREPWKKNPKIALQQIKESKAYKSLSNQGLSQEEILKKMSEKQKTKVFTWDGEKEVEMSSLDSVLHHFAMMQTGFLVMNGKSGDILAWVGGSNYKYFKYDHVTSHRQAGSTFKPIVYAAALENGTTPCQFYPNDSIVYTDYNDWVPRNADRKYGGSYSVKGALANSVNTVSVQLLMQTGFDRVIRLAHDLGIHSELPEVPSLALGAGEISLLEMVEAYSVFLNKGKTVDPVFIRKIEDQQGRVLYTSKTTYSEDQILSEETSQRMLAMMKGVVDNGTAHGLRSIYGFNNELAGKTGTTQQNTDGWFIGLSPDLVIGTWTGGDNPAVRFRSTTYGQGSYAAMPVFARFMKKVYNDPLYKNLEKNTFQIPEEIVAEFDCENFREKDPDEIEELFEKAGESIDELIKRIFKRKKKKKRRKDKEHESED